MTPIDKVLQKEHSFYQKYHLPKMAPGMNNAISQKWDLTTTFLIFWSTESKIRFWKSEFYKNKKVFQIDDIDVTKIQVSKKDPYGTNNALKYFIGCNDNDVIRPLCVRPPQIIGYAKKFNENATMSLELTINSFLKNIIKYGKKLKSY